MLAKRIKLIDKLTTFLYVDSHNSRITWLRDRKLFHHFQEHYSLKQKDNEEFWVEYWLEKSRHANPNIFAHKHIASYLEETTYWLSEKLAKIDSQINYSAQDLMQVARINLLNQEKFARLFNKYDATRGSITKFAQYRLGTVLYDFIHIGQTKRKYSDAGLLRNVSYEFIKDALSNFGIQNTEGNYKLSQHLFAWRCFNEIYKPRKEAGSQKLAWPNREQLEAIANRYNQLLAKPQELISNGKSNRWLRACVTALQQTTINREELEELLLICVKALRNNTSPTIDSLDRLLGTAFDDRQATLIDTIESQDLSNYYEDREDEPDELVNQEWNEIQTIIFNAYEQLPQAKKKMLQLEFGLDITQGEIANAFEVAQTTVSRVKNTLLKAVTSWSQERYKLTLNPQQIRDISNSLDSYLSRYFQSNFSELLTGNFYRSISHNFSANTLEIFNLYYMQNLPLSQVAQSLNTPESTLQEIINGVKQQLYLKLSEEVQKDLPFSPEGLPIKLNAIASAERQISTFVDRWLQKTIYTQFEN
ncbi:MULTISPECIES: hypothetical protein [Calothrix]|uniref:RNA polymerase sigma-70 region 4 domain-containing protein n=2 Tax=Calothrix TaxID=1186 RepID=A0ABR8AJI4_9CYAN|nr:MULTISPECIES: hypothetical protein [Calothrix]MBD2200177.1 hypothetical protein [Calothrix parietina FACHB-288]MBD2229168.1 hypothetical protein [Calothrix anomala FACHB-343]